MIFWKDDIPIVVTIMMVSSISFLCWEIWISRLGKFSISDGERILNRFLQSPSDRRDHIHSATVQKLTQLMAGIGSYK